MRGEWNGLQALFINDFPYAYYVHCLAHQLQLALIAAAREISDVSFSFRIRFLLVTLLVLLISVMMNYGLFKQLQLNI
jgi:hypothetical protein